MSEFTDPDFNEGWRPAGGNPGGNLTPEPNRLYASLIGPLLGCYFPSEVGQEELEFRQELNKSRLRPLWHTIYSAEQVSEQLKTFPNCTVLPRNRL